MNTQLAMWDLCDCFNHFKPVKSTDWKWTMSEDYPHKNGLKVASMFSCGGGSTMGYKLSGCEVIANVEIDSRMNAIYNLNHNPQYSYCMDLREFNKMESLPKELYDLDILDGSPPCTLFSLAGVREKGWGVERKYKEGQVLQTLDDLSYIFIDTVIKLKPKTVIMENVEGLVKGNAWSYVREIYSKLFKAGYKVKHYILKGEAMGVPQKRHRVFFIAVRKDIEYDLDKVDLIFNYSPIPYRDIREGELLKCSTRSKTYNLLKEVRSDENCLVYAHERLYNKKAFYQTFIIDDDSVLPTIRTKSADFYRRGTHEHISKLELRSSATFPRDYNFNGVNMVDVIGMSVPPIMMKRIVNRLIDSGLFDYKLRSK